MTMAVTARKVTSDWQLDHLYETDTAKELERAYAEGFECSIACACITQADFYLGQAVNEHCYAFNKLDGTPYEKEMEDLISKLEDLRCDFKALGEKMKRG